MGLDSAGKTSILTSLKGDNRLSSYFKVTPTKGVSRGDIQDGSTEFNIFDFGGQEVYVKAYLQDLEQHLFEVDKVIFVIDIQDTKRHSVALEYLRKVLDHLASHHKNVQVSIFFHKFDKLLENDITLDLGTIAQKLTRDIMKIVPKSMQVEFFQTSIFTVFQKTRMKAPEI